MTMNWNLLVPTVVVIGAAAAQVRTMIVERRTGQVIWWAKLPIFPRQNYDDPVQFRLRQRLNVVGSIAWIAIAVFLSAKLLGF